MAGAAGDRGNAGPLSGFLVKKRGDTNPVSASVPLWQQGTIFNAEVIMGTAKAILPDFTGA
jgi:hypothetical protein